MSLPLNSAEREALLVKESTTTTGQAGLVVVNPDGTSVGGGGKYNATPPTLADGGTTSVQFDVNGNTKVRETYQPLYEDNTNGVAKVEAQYSYKSVITADAQVKSSAGFLHTVTISCNDAAPTAGSIIIYDNTAESGTQVFNHTFTTTPFMPFSVVLDYVMATGIYIGFTTTADVNVSCSYR